MHLALGSVTEGLLTQIASHTFRGYVSALGSCICIAVLALTTAANGAQK